MRKRDGEYKSLYSQAVQQVADRYHGAGERFLQGSSRFPREKKAHRYYSPTGTTAWCTLRAVGRS